MRCVENAGQGVAEGGGERVSRLSLARTGKRRSIVLVSEYHVMMHSVLAVSNNLIFRILRISKPSSGNQRVNRNRVNA